MSASPSDSTDILIATPSFRGDFERCAVLCRSIDEFAGPDFRHLVVVPRRDLAMFEGLKGPRREIATVEDVVPIAAVHLPARRELWWAGYRRRLRGWVMQQIVKIAVALESESRAVVFADSDVAFIRPFSSADFIHNGKVRFYRVADVDLPAIDRHYPKWVRGANRLLGIPDAADDRTDYIGPLVSWDPVVVAEMCDRIEAVTGRSWASAVSHMSAHAGVSEFLTYGRYVDHVATAVSKRLFAVDTLLCPTWYAYDMSTEAGRADLIDAIDATHLGIVVQSNLRLPASVMQDVKARAAQRLAAV